MKKKNHVFKVALLCMALVAVLTVGFVANTKTKASADSKFFDWFDRISVDKCAISLVQDEFQWTGKQIKPEVKVNYKGTDLVKNEDYLLSYKNNIDAGTAKIVIEGKGDYKGKASVNFEIVGIDFKKECIVSINNDNVEVYYKGQLLINKTDYWYTVLKQELLKESVPTNKGYINTYEVTKYYTINGKGKFGGTIVKTFTTTETKLENVTWTEEE